MKFQDNLFCIVIFLACLIVGGVITENMHIALTPPSIKKSFDVQKIKSEIEGAGLIPHDALHWKTVDH